MSVVIFLSVLCNKFHSFLHVKSLLHATSSTLQMSRPKNLKTSEWTDNSSYTTAILKQGDTACINIKQTTQTISYSPNNIHL